MAAGLPQLVPDAFGLVLEGLVVLGQIEIQAVRPRCLMQLSPDPLTVSNWEVRM